MNKYSGTSKSRLETCHPDLQVVFQNVLQICDHSILEGERPREIQDQYFREGKSKLQYPNSKHNYSPSLAVDAALYLPGKGVSYNPHHCCFFAGVVTAVAASLNIVVRWGGNWDQDAEVVTDQTFQDLVHFELIKGA